MASLHPSLTAPKDEGHGSHTWAADSPDRHDGRVPGPALDHGPHDGPNVFAPDDSHRWTPVGRIPR